MTRHNSCDTHGRSLKVRSDSNQCGLKFIMQIGEFLSCFKATPTWMPDTCAKTASLVLSKSSIILKTKFYEELKLRKRNILK